jgi:hypothetical protein
MSQRQSSDEDEDVKKVVSYDGMPPLVILRLHDEAFSLL